jgi:tetratricopeptide (TPR) repeat protein/predicted Ser/Thr protein kinase
MTADRYARLSDLFDRARLVERGARASFLDRECAGDPELRRELTNLLMEDDSDNWLLDRPGTVLDAVGAGDCSGPACGPYRLQRLLGEGGSGIVYLGVRDDIGGQAAVKLLRDAWVSPSRRERFRREQRTLAKLNHPGIARLLDAGVTADGTPWIAMEYVEGLPLTAHAGAANLPADARIRLLQQVCDAVQYAHDRAIIHRDLKPSNILVGSDGQVRLLDFGIARQADSANQEATRTGLRMMTPGYAAPEVARGEAGGVFSDVYSLGVILRELLGGPEAKGELGVICATATHEDPARRYRSAEALRRDLDRYLAGEPLDARPDSLGYRFTKFVGRNRVGVLAGLSMALLLAGAAAVFTWRLKLSRDEAAASADRAQRIQTFLMNLFEGGDSAAGPSSGLTVAELIDRGVREAGALDREPAVQSEVLATLGKMYGKLGRYDDASRLLSQALERGGRRSRDLAAMAALRAEQGQLDAAEGFAREAIARAEDEGALASGEEALGLALTEKGKYDDAVALLERVVARRQNADPELRASSLTQLAGAHYYAGRYDRARELNEQALTLRQATHGSQHPSVAEGLINLGAIDFDLGKYAEAEAKYRRALSIKQGWYGPQHPEAALALTMLGRALVYQGRNADAEKVLLEALEIRERTFGANHTSVASVRNDLGNIALARKQFAAAAEHFRRMEEIYRAGRGDAHYLVATAMSNRGAVYSQQGDYARAEAIFRDVIDRYTKALSADHLNTGIARIRLGRALVRQKRWAEAREQSLAGYRIVSSQTQPNVSWLNGARTDLVAASEALGDSASAAKYKAELEVSANLK